MSPASKSDPAPRRRALHRLAALAAGAPLALLGLTGAGLVYPEWMQAPARPLPSLSSAAEPLPLAQAAARVLAAHPNRQLLYVQLPLRPGEPLEFVLRGPSGPRLVAADPATGEPLAPPGAGPPTPIEPVRRLHAHWLLGAFGRHINGALAALLALIALSGLALSLRRPRSLHARLGLLAALPLLAASLSGLLLIWARVSPAPPPLTGASPALTLDQYAAAARAALPGASLSWISLGDPVTARLRLPSDWQRRGSNDIHLHPASGQLLRADLYREAPPARRLFVALSALHYGETARPFWAATGLALGGLWLSGLWVWRRNRNSE